MAVTYGFCLGESNTLYSAGQFAEAFSRLFGDGVCPWGSGFSCQVSGFGIVLGTGFALIKGHWVKNDEPLALPLAPADSHADRTDLAGARLDRTARRVELSLLKGTLPEEAGPDILPLYTVKVKRGVTDLLPTDLTDQRRQLPVLSALSGEGLRACEFLSSGIDREVERIIRQGEALVEKGSQAVKELDRAILAAGAGAALGDLRVARDHPGPGWLLCGGGPVPGEFPQLGELLGGELPRIPPVQGRIFSYIFGGEGV